MMYQISGSIAARVVRFAVKGKIQGLFGVKLNVSSGPITRGRHPSSLYGRVWRKSVCYGSEWHFKAFAWCRKRPWIVHYALHAFESNTIASWRECDTFMVGFERRQPGNRAYHKFRCSDFLCGAGITSDFLLSDFLFMSYSWTHWPPLSHFVTGGNGLPHAAWQIKSTGLLCLWNSFISRRGIYHRR